MFCKYFGAQKGRKIILRCIIVVRWCTVCIYVTGNEHINYRAFDMSFVINTHLCFKQSAKSYANFIQMIHGVTKICDTYLLQAVKVCLDNQHTGTALQSTQWLTLWCCISQHTCTCGSPIMFLTCWKEEIKYDIFSRLLGIDTYSFEIDTCDSTPTSPSLRFEEPPSNMSANIWHKARGVVSTLVFVSYLNFNTTYVGVSQNITKQGAISEQRC